MKKKPNHWNYRVMVSEHKGEYYFEIHEVHYKKDKPVSYSTNPAVLGSEYPYSLLWTLGEMSKAIVDKPVLWKGELFPEEFKYTYRDDDGIWWRFEGSRAISKLTDELMDSLSKIKVKKKK